MSIARKDFLKAGTALLFSSSALLALSRCGASPGATCTNGAKNGDITSNHGHALTVPAADVQSGAEKTYAIKGTSGHDHSITIKAADFALLKQGQTFVATSTEASSHTHQVTVQCA
jgi:hypothetical protein